MIKVGDKVWTPFGTATVTLTEETDEGTRLYLSDGGWVPASMAKVVR